MADEASGGQRPVPLPPSGDESEPRNDPQDVSNRLDEDEGADEGELDSGRELDDYEVSKD